MNTDQHLSNAVYDEAKRQHVAEANECVPDTPTVVESNESERGYVGGVQHNLKAENDDLKGEDQQ